MHNPVPRWLSAIPLLAGITLIGIALFDPNDAAFSAGRGAVVAAGGVFLFAGAAIFLNSLRTPYRSVLLAANTTGLLALLSLVPVAGATDGDTALLLGAVLGVALTVLAGSSTVREWRRIRGDQRLPKRPQQ